MCLRRQPLARRTQSSVLAGGDRLRIAGPGQGGSDAGGRQSFPVDQRPAQDGRRLRFYAGIGDFSTKGDSDRERLTRGTPNGPQA